MRDVVCFGEHPLIYRCEGVNGMGWNPILLINVQKTDLQRTWVAMNHNHFNNHGIKTEAWYHCTTSEFVAVMATFKLVKIFCNTNAHFITIPHILQKIRKERLKEENLGSHKM